MHPHTSYIIILISFAFYTYMIDVFSLKMMLKKSKQFNVLSAKSYIVVLFILFVTVLQTAGGCSRKVYLGQRGSNTRIKNYVMRSSMIFTHHQILTSFMIFTNHQIFNQLHYFHTSSNINQVIQPRTGHLAHMENR